MAYVHLGNPQAPNKTRKEDKKLMVMIKGLGSTQNEGHDDKLTSLTQQTHPQSISVKKHNGKKTKIEEVKDT
ncbi:hypothetical protein Tco_0454276 [Tanacetum coccineum]